MPRPVISQHGTPSRWRGGCPCVRCLNAHNADSRDRRREARVEMMHPHERVILAALRDGVPMPDAVTGTPVTVAMMIGRAAWDTQWRSRMDEALMIGRDPLLDHGSEQAYRHGRCRCPECREFKSQSRPTPAP